MPVPEYRIVSRIGGGATSEIFLAEHSEKSGTFVVKRLAVHLCGNSEYLNLFRHEAELLALLHHSGIPQLIEFHNECERPEIHMQFMPGRSLFGIFQEKRKLRETLPASDALDIMRRLCEIAAHVHEARLANGEPAQALHRDICPMNIIIGLQNRVSLIDFGSAASRLLENEPQDALFGRFSYLAPEQTRGEKASVASEIFSLGIIAYELFCGVHPFRAYGAEATLCNIESASCLPPGCACPGLSPAVESLISRMLHIEAQERPPGVRVVLDELNSLKI